MSDVSRGHREDEWAGIANSFFVRQVDHVLSFRNSNERKRHWLHPLGGRPRGINNAPLAGLATRTPKG